MKYILSNATIYFYLRQAATLGIPFKKWFQLFKLSDKRILDLGCGPADIMRFANDDLKKPEYYLGIEISDKYIAQASSLLKQKSIDHNLVNLDLTRLQTTEISSQLYELATENQVNLALLIGVMHHIDDQSVIETLNLLYDINSIQQIYTEDVILEENNFINNFYSRLDRGEFVRTKQDYDELIRKSKWNSFETFITHPGVFKINYYHFRIYR